MGWDVKVAERLIEYCLNKGVKSVRIDDIAIEFFPKASEPMALDPLALSKVLMNSMPDDQAMLFAATEGIREPLDTDKPILNPSQGNTDPMT